jgi:hypothetical protein
VGNVDLLVNNAAYAQLTTLGNIEEEVIDK